MGAVKPRRRKRAAGAAWLFERREHDKTLRVVEPDGTEHNVKLGDMNSTAGIALLNAMVRDLAVKP